MRKNSLRWIAVPALALCTGLAGCEVMEDNLESNWLADAGYEKIPERSRDRLPAHARPNPPPARPLASAGGAGVPVLAAAATPAGVTQEMVEQGAELYGTVCSACHAAGGSGGPAAPALDDPAWIHISGAYDEIVAIIKSGVASPREYPAPMPPLGGGSFDDEQVRAIAAYVFALSNAEAS